MNTSQLIRGYYHSSMGARKIGYGYALSASEEVRRILLAEARSLRMVASNLSQDDITRAISIILQSEGHVIMTGMGKSGLVARRLASTFSSLGTPSFFIHPSEASHGDLGMIKKQDVLIVLSVSGSTTDIHDIIAYASQYEVPTIGITFEKESFLSRMASCSLVLPSVKEVCYMGLAPTTSSTVMMVIGDAIAICLAKKRGFTNRDLVKLHPKGSLAERSAD